MAIFVDAIFPLSQCSMQRIYHAHIARLKIVKYGKRQIDVCVQINNY